MNLKGTMRLSLLFALGLVALTAFVFPGNPIDRSEQLTWQMSGTPSPTLTVSSTPVAGSTLITSSATLTLTATVSPTLTATSTATPTLQPAKPRGDTPETAIVPTFVRPYDCIEMMCPGASGAPELNQAGGWGWIEAKTTTWYKASDWGALQLSIWLYVNGQGGMTFDIYPPDRKDLYGQPVGRGSFNPSQRPADLFWTGRSMASGIWYIRLTNHNAFPVMYSLRYTVSIPAMANRCDACHGPLRDLMWDRCVSSGNNWCNDLQDLYDTNPSQFEHYIP